MRRTTHLIITLALLALGAGSAAAQALGFGPPMALNTNAATDSGDDVRCHVTTDGAGNWVAVWESWDTLGGTIGTDEDILVSRSTDNGATWTPPAALNTNAATDSGVDAGSQVTTDGLGNWVAVWFSNDSLSGTIGTDLDILVSRSTDNGVTLIPVAALNTDAATDSGDDFGPHVTTDSAGNWVTVWVSGTGIQFSRSTDHGVTWTPPATLASSGGAARLAINGAGNGVAVWQSFDNLGGTIGTDGDILVSTSTWLQTAVEVWEVYR